MKKSKKTCILLFITILLASGCEKKYSESEYREDALFLNETMVSVEKEFINLLGSSDKSTCQEWVNTVRKNMVDNTTTDLGENLVHKSFDMYQVMLDEFISRGIVGNPMMAQNYLQEISEEKKVIQINEKLEQAKSILKESAGY